jgi:hypothetical protein
MFGGIPLVGEGEPLKEESKKRGFTEDDQERIASELGGNQTKKRRGLGFSSNTAEASTAPAAGTSSAPATAVEKDNEPPATSVPAKAKAVELGRVSIAGFSFDSKNALHTKVKELQKELESSGASELAGANLIFAFDLLRRHRDSFKKMEPGLDGVSYAEHARFPGAKCFIFKTSDGNEEVVSAKKAIEAAFTGEAPTAGPAASSKGYHAVPPPASLNAKQSQKRELAFRPGCVIEISGLGKLEMTRDGGATVRSVSLLFISLCLAILLICC